MGRLEGEAGSGCGWEHPVVELRPDGMALQAEHGMVLLREARALHFAIDENVAGVSGGKDLGKRVGKRVSLN